MSNPIHFKQAVDADYNVLKKKIVKWLPINFDSKFPDLGGCWLWLPKINATEKHHASVVDMQNNNGVKSS